MRGGPDCMGQKGPPLRITGYWWKNSYPSEGTV